MIEPNKPSKFAMKAAEIISDRPKISYDAICDAVDQSFKPLLDSHEKLLRAAMRFEQFEKIGFCVHNETKLSPRKQLSEAITAAQAVAKQEKTIKIPRGFRQILNGELLKDGDLCVPDQLNTGKLSLYYETGWPDEKVGSDNTQNCIYIRKLKSRAKR